MSHLCLRLTTHSMSSGNCAELAKVSTFGEAPKTVLGLFSSFNGIKKSSMRLRVPTSRIDVFWMPSPFETIPHGTSLSTPTTLISGERKSILRF
jgi:hypothetical protein